MTTTARAAITAAAAVNGWTDESYRDSSAGDVMRTYTRGALVVLVRYNAPGTVGWHQVNGRFGTRRGQRAALLELLATPPAPAVCDTCDTEVAQDGSCGPFCPEGTAAEELGLAPVEQPGKVGPSDMVITPAKLAELHQDPATRVDLPANLDPAAATWGVVVWLKEGRPGAFASGQQYRVLVVLTDTETHARQTLAPFHAFYDNTRHVHVLQVQG